MTLNVGVVGVGMIGQDHIRRLTTVLAGANVIALSDVNAAQAQAVASRLNRAKVYATGEELIGASVSAVVGAIEVRAADVEGLKQRRERNDSDD